MCADGDFGFRAVRGGRDAALVHVPLVQQQIHARFNFASIEFVAPSVNFGADARARFASHFERVLRVGDVGDQFHVRLAGSVEKLKRPA